MPEPSTLTCAAELPYGVFFPLRGAPCGEPAVRVRDGWPVCKEHDGEDGDE